MSSSSSYSWMAGPWYLVSSLLDGRWEPFQDPERRVMSEKDQRINDGQRIFEQRLDWRAFKFISNSESS